jgi:meiotically up-regulated gene 157 (Mug157) protein
VPAGGSPAPVIRPAPILEGLRELLESRGAPPQRAQLAVRATEALVTRAVTAHDDGTVFVTTGDIPAMWLRDSAAQVRPLLALAADVLDVVELARGVLRTQVEAVLLDSRANAFNDGPTGAAQRRDFRDQSPSVFERKYAVDSLCAPLGLAWSLRQATGSVEHVDTRFRQAAAVVVSLWREEQEHGPAGYRFRRRLARRRDSPPRGGRGTPVGRTGMTWSAFRPSDDACRYGYHVPANALAAVSLERVAELLAATGDQSAAREAAALADEIRRGVEDFGRVQTTSHGIVYAYEVDGLGGELLLDDANVPSLVSLPYLGYCDRTDPVYLATRAWALSSANPYWSEGRAVSGVGSRHTRRGRVWPLGIAVEGLTAASSDERERALRRIEATVQPGGLLHESVHPSAPHRFSRRWFSWADMLYVELVLASLEVNVA